MSEKEPLVFLVAGESSGDLLGERLMMALKELRPGVRFAGVGGPRMVRAGLDSLFPMDELAVMGLAEVLPHLPRLMARIRDTAQEVLRLAPDALVTIDSPDFSFRVAKKVKAAGRGIPLIHYVAPSVWAWRPGRARKIASFLDHLLALLPFEPPYFEREGLPCTFVGHLAIEDEGGGARGDGQSFRQSHGVSKKRPILCVLPGSRSGEVARLAPVFGQALGLLAGRHPGLLAVVPTVPHVEAAVRKMVADWPVESLVVSGIDDKFDAFAAATAALAASGTVTVELAAAGVPTVVAYRVNAFSAWLARRLIKVDHVSLINIVLDCSVQPELLQDACTPKRLAESTHILLSDDAARRSQIVQAEKALKALGKGGSSPSYRAAEAVLGVIGGKKK